MPRKATSKAQFRLFKAVESGDAKLPGMSPSEAKEMTAGQTQAGLPERRKVARKRKQVKGRFRV